MNNLNVLRDKSEITPMTMDDLNAAICDDKNFAMLYEDEAAKKDTLDIINAYVLRPMEDKNISLSDTVPWHVHDAVNKKFGRGNVTEEEKELHVRDILDTILSRYMMSLDSNKTEDQPEITKEKGDMTPVMASVSYDTATGKVDPITTDENQEMDPDLEKIYNETDIDDMFEDLFSGNTGISQERLEKVLGKDFMSSRGLTGGLEDMSEFLKVLNAYNRGEIKDNYYKALPKYIQNQIAQSIPPHIFTKERATVLNSSAKMLLEDVSKSYYQKSTDTTDLDNLIGQIYKAKEEFDTGMKQINSSLHVVKFNNIIKLFQDRRAAMVDANEDEKVKLIDEVFLGPMLETIELTKFKEFCKTVRIKKYDVERPDKIFNRFNNRYLNHTKNIYNIANCPNVLKQQIKNREDPETDAYKVCLAFCKYAQNMSPDNDADHTFMYYFIKNILVLNLIYPKGIVVESDVVNDETKAFYSRMIDSLRECIKNLDR